ncbi:MAG TPA: leucyl/phenylalanyl-tRNA--protein transferase [Gemmataceae bacterium]|nr:leucyl/phenylalanyl-tRNA--protein transferase [Gemmataceae bacterium]
MLDWLRTLLTRRLRARRSQEEDRAWINPEDADPFGIVGFGGDLAPERLLAAYSQGVFPMYDEGEPICWWSPDPRAIIELGELHISRRLQRTINSGKFTVTLDKNFEAVMRACGERKENTWINSEMLQAYCRLHELGHAHSAEVWHEGELAGGVYGVSLGGLFAGESMFYRERDASKVALAFLFERLRACGFELFDTQILNDHTASLGAKEIPRSEYLQRLPGAIDKPVRLR